MKNYSKNKFADDKNKNLNKGSKSNNSSKSLNFYDRKKSNSRSNKLNRNSNSNINSTKNLKLSYESRTKDKFVNDIKNSGRRNASEDNFEFSSKNKDRNLYPLPNKRNFDDWIWGKHSVYAALASDRAINRIWYTSEIFSSEKFYILLKEIKTKGVLVEEVSWNRISQLTLGASHQGIAMQLAHTNSISLNKLIELSKSNAKNPIILALDGITDPHNLGAIIRSAEAFDCKGIVIPQRRSAGLTGTVAKVAAGALEHIPVSRVVNLNRSIEEFKKNGFIILGLTGRSQLPISEFNEKCPLVVIVGAEDKGISLITQKKCDYLVKIPLIGKTTSLNASVAAAISIFYLKKINK